MAMSFRRELFDDLLGSHPASAYMISIEGNGADISRVGTRWIPLDEKAALNCSLNAQEFKRMTPEQLRLLSDILNFLNAEDTRMFCQWVMVSCWEHMNGLILIVRNSFPEEDAAGERTSTGVDATQAP
ncbi:hypothetical protein ABW21_db0202384 [Orbilia brochopaga]|nr:hypothetical protein ABW21_db0202384 [Drechslerella brochopaga]